MRAAAIGITLSVVCNGIAILIPMIGTLGLKDGGEKALELIALVFAGALSAVTFTLHFNGFV